MPLNVEFPAGFQILQRLFGAPLVNVRDVRMNAIHQHTETYWQTYVNKIPRQTGVKYLLLAEAPPWSANGRPQYVLDPVTPPSVLIKAISRAFFNMPVNPAGMQTTLDMLAENGFLIIDTLPFAMPYSNMRIHAAYTALVAACCQTYLQEKIMHPSLVWSDEVKIAFAFKVNGQKVIESLINNITIGNKEYELNEQLIAADASGFTNGNRLREIYGLNQL
jgi:hypothetical protein